MPELTGRAHALYLHQDQGGNRYAQYIDAVKEGRDPPETAAETIEFSHKLFHDAESTFWVIAWTLARSASQDYEKETSWQGPYRNFIETMAQHFTNGIDGRMVLESSVSFWRQVLHRDLQDQAPMLSQMHRYIRPEWAYREELDPEHVHEALMRLLLAEIVKLEDANADVPLKYACRTLPHSTNVKKASASFQSSTSQNTSLGRTKGTPTEAGPLLPPERQAPSLSVGRKRSSSHLGDSTSPKPRRSPRLAELQLAESGRSQLEDLAVQESVMAKAKEINWGVMKYELEHP
jgi:hypothetical protein